MKYKIIIGSKKLLTKEQAEKIIEFLHSSGYERGSIEHVGICDGCEIELPENYTNNLCPNCEDGLLQAKRSHD